MPPAAPPSQTPPHHELLGVPRDASPAEIRSAFRALARTAHPDKGGSAELFARVQRAATALLLARQRGDPAADDEDVAQPPPAARHPAPPPARSEAVTLEQVWLSDDDGEEDGKESHSKQAAAGAAPPLGAVEGALLDHLAALGVRCDAATQLVVTCEVCRRPATRTCWVCQADVCELCTRTPHAKGRWGVHWPLINAPGSLSRQLALKEFEAKRLEDARAYEEAQPGFVPEAQRMVQRDFREACARAANAPDAHRRYDAELARHYLWAQTDRAVHLAVHLPEGMPGREACVELGPTGRRLKVWSGQEGSGQEASAGVGAALCVVDRLLAGEVDLRAPVDIMRSADNRFVVLVLPKADSSLSSSTFSPGAQKPWRRLFEGDSDGARLVAAGGGCGGPAYRLAQDRDEVVMEVDLPSWVLSEDVSCQVRPDGAVLVRVEGLLDLRRTLFGAGAASTDSKASTGHAKDGTPRHLMLDAQQCAWSLSRAAPAPPASPPAPPPHLTAPRTRPGGAAAPRAAPLATLTLVMPKRPLTQEELLYKHGVRQDNLVARRADGRPGAAALFLEDEDEWGLTALLQASVFRAVGRVWLHPRPWEAAAPGGAPSSAAVGRWAQTKADLPEDVATLLRAEG